MSETQVGYLVPMFHSCLSGNVSVISRRRRIPSNSLAHATCRLIDFPQILAHGKQWSTPRILSRLYLVHLRQIPRLQLSPSFKGSSWFMGIGGCLGHGVAGYETLLLLLRCAVLKLPSHRRRRPESEQKGRTEYLSRYI